METLCPNCLDVKPEFFKVIIGDQIMLKMRIPPAFVKHVSEKSSERVTLECPGGDIWHAKLSRRADGMFIEDGWEKFLRDQSLGDEEFLVFRYNGDLHFSVTIFDKSACWREDSFEVNNPSQVANHPGSNPSMSFETNKHGTAEKPRRNRFLGLQNPNQENNIQSSSISCLFHDTGQRKSSPNSVKHYEIARSKEWEAAFTFKKPYFIVEMKEHCVDKPFYVTIPSSFVRSYIPYKKVKMVLQTDNNKRWPVSFSKFATRSCICGGWAKFCLDSNLRKGDYCAFELVDELELRVYISRVH
uniref:TF-B3 domain-containing protein n=1 Tax=Nelumbo nucifera TaxID=4432 RepID=A0A822ZBJ9_NELNU|nr:TPA_asm: hypothetical protein HUJ06_000732 [Nelumbo nucifera]